MTQKRIKLEYLRCLLTDLLEIRSEGRSQDPFRMVFYAKLQFVSKKTPKLNVSAKQKKIDTQKKNQTRISPVFIDGFA